MMLSATHGLVLPLPRVPRRRLHPPRRRMPPPRRKRPPPRRRMMMMKWTFSETTTKMKL
jgi:hypothetical protein